MFPWNSLIMGHPEDGYRLTEVTRRENFLHTNERVVFIAYTNRLVGIGKILAANMLEDPPPNVQRISYTTISNSTAVVILTNFTRKNVTSNSA